MIKETHLALFTLFMLLCNAQGETIADTIKNNYPYLQNNFHGYWLEYSTISSTHQSKKVEYYIDYSLECKSFSQIFDF
jgi:hypothetical protein